MYELIFRSRFGYATAGGVSAVAILFIGMMWADGGPILAAISAVLPISLAYFTWWMWAWPALIVDSSGIRVRNQLRTVRIGWDAFHEAEAQFGLYLSVEQAPGTRQSADAPPRRIYVAGVPARGGFSANRKKEAPQVPELYFTRGPRITLRVDPGVAARMLDEEKYYHDQPGKRPSANIPSTETVRGWESRGAVQRWLYGVSKGSAPFKGVTITPNWVALGILLALAAGSITYGILG